MRPLCLRAHLVTDPKTIAENHHGTAAAIYRAGVIKHKEEVYRLFHDDHVKAVRFRLSCATDAIVNSMK